MTLRVVLGSCLLLLAVLGVGGALAYSKYSSIRAQMFAPPPPEMPESVNTASVQTVKTRMSTSSMGTVVAARWITLENEIAGTVQKSSVKSGQIVESGQVLLVLEKSVESAQLQFAQARQRIAESTFKRTQLAGAAMALTELEVEQTAAELEQAKAEVSRLQATIDKKTLRAPFRARVGLINVHEGQYLHEGTDITTLMGTDDKIFVDFMIPQQVSEHVTTGQEIKLLLPSGPLSAQVVATDSKADRSTRNLMVRAELPNPPSWLVPNDSVTVEIAFGPESTVLAVPTSAIRRAPEGAFVYIVEADKEQKSRARMRTVVVGRNQENLATILGGISSNARVITEGSFKLREGALIAEQPNVSSDGANKVAP